MAFKTELQRISSWFYRPIANFMLRMTLTLRNLMLSTFHSRHKAIDQPDPKGYTQIPIPFLQTQITFGNFYFFSPSFQKLNCSQQSAETYFLCGKKFIISSNSVISPFDIFSVFKLTYNRVPLSTLKDIQTSWKSNFEAIVSNHTHIEMSSRRSCSFLEPHGRLSDSCSSDNSEDLVIFTVLGDGKNQHESTESEESSSCSEAACSSDENGWTSDCEQLCSNLLMASGESENLLNNCIQSKLMNPSFDNANACKENLSILERRYAQGVDLSHMTDLWSDASSSDNSEDEENELVCSSVTNHISKVQVSENSEHWNYEADSGTGSCSTNSSSNQSDSSSTCDEEIASKNNERDQNRSKIENLPTTPSLQHRKLIRTNTSNYPPFFIPSALVLDHSPDAIYSSFLLNQSELFEPSHESDWESDTESEDVETHYPSRSSRSKLKAAEAAAANTAENCSRLLSNKDGLTSANPLITSQVQTNGSNIGETKPVGDCVCSSNTILKCAFCVNSRKQCDRATHKRNVRFPTIASELEVKYYLEESEEEDLMNDYINNSPNTRTSFFLKQSPNSFSCSTMLSPNYCIGSSSRKSPWETMARDRYRFQRRIFLTDNKISYVLQPEHRRIIYNARFDCVNNTANTWHPDFKSN